MLKSYYEVTNVSLANAKRISGFVSADKLQSEKPYPVFEFDEQEYFFKPVSRTKPWCTDLFPLAEVFIANLAQAIDYPNVNYRLAICAGLSEQNIKYFNNGSLSDSFLQPGEQAISVHEYLCAQENVSPNFRNYTNYCGIVYDYREIFNSQLLRSRPDLAERLAEKIIWSIYTANQNFQYSNVMLIKDGQENIAHFGKCFDNEFSTFFISAENPLRQIYCLMEIQNSSLVKNELLFLRKQFPQTVNSLEEKILNLSRSDKLKELCDFTPAKDFIKNTYDFKDSLRLDLKKNIAEGNDKAIKKIIKHMDKLSSNFLCLEKFSENTLELFSTHIETIHRIGQNTGIIN